MSEAADVIANVIRVGTGVDLPIVPASEDATHPATLTRIYAGTYGPRTPDGVWTLARGLDADGFVVATTPTSVTLLGLNKFGAGFACYEFCERYVGARRLMPGDSGLHVPPASTLTAPVRGTPQSPFSPCGSSVP